jgi:hypothetical protein
MERRAGEEGSMDERKQGAETVNALFRGDEEAMQAAAPAEQAGRARLTVRTGVAICPMTRIVFPSSPPLPVA